MWLKLSRDKSWLLLTFICMIPFMVSAQDIPASSYGNANVLIISSYNPDISSTSANISAFVDEYRNREGRGTVIIENMNCKSLVEAPLWKKRMKSILRKYTSEKVPPLLIVLLGQEAWAAYLSQDVADLPGIPVLGGMVSRNFVEMPDSTCVVSDWNPEI